MTTSAKITLQYGPSPTRLWEAVLPELPEAVNISYSWMYICENSYRARRLQKSFLEKFGLDAALEVPVMSHQRFMEKIFTVFPLRESYLGDQESLILLYLLIHLNEAHKLPSQTRQVFRSPQIIRELWAEVQMMSQTKTEGKIPGNPEEPVNKIVAAYQKAKAGRYLDQSDTLRLFIRDVDLSRWQAHFPECRTLFFEISRPVSPLEILFFRKLRDLGINLRLLFRYHQNPELDGPLQSGFEELRSLCDEVAPANGEDDISRSFYVLAARWPSRLPRVAVRKHADRFQEAETIAAAIKKMLVEKSCVAERIAIAIPSAPKYRDLLINSLQNYGIPFTVHLPENLSEQAPIRHLRLFLEALHENFPLSVLAKILRSPFFAYREKLAGLPVEAMLKSLRQNYGLDEMLRQLDRLRAYWKNETGREVLFDPAALQPLRNILMDIQLKINKLQSEFRPSEFRDFFESIIADNDIEARILCRDGAQNRRPTGNALRPLKQFRELLKNFVYLTPPVSREAVFSPADALNLFDFLVSSRVYRPIQLRNYGVQIISPGQIEAFDPRVLFVPGLIAADFPRQNAKHLPGIASHVADMLPYADRRFFLNCLDGEERRVFFSYPEWEGENRLQPSEVLGEFLRLTGVEAVAPPEPEVFSEAQLLTLPEISAKSDDDEFAKTVRKVVGEASWNQFRRQLRSQNSRKLPAQNPFNGFVGANEQIARYLQLKFSDYPFSASALETFARSPVQFFVDRILRVSPPEPFEGWLNPREKGTLIHRVLYRFYHDLPPENRTETALRQIAEQEWQKTPLPPSILTDIQREMFLGSPSRPGLFAKFLESERQWLTRTGLTPAYFEQSFGSLLSGDGSAPHAALELELGGDKISLRGFIDRIDLTADGGWVVVDYKTGNIPSHRDIEEGVSLQLPLYLLAVRQIMRAKRQNGVPVAAVYYGIKSNRDQDVKIRVMFADSAHMPEGFSPKRSLPSDEISEDGRLWTLDDYLNRSLEFAIRYANAIRAGNFAHAEEATLCRRGEKNRCPIQAVCRFPG